MIETRHQYSREDVGIEVVYDTGETSSLYLGIRTKTESFEVNIDRQDFPALLEMLNDAYKTNF
ncbi:hypothetical protein OG393_29340 [Streptomyces sp. NBC_01216]|uniref:hypothetical protein n=1 Tax=Streptomyces sp. NBC_01216 TaxID=2903778 RepID=UPI002E132EF5|nr:hypothetical protein OG393_29340 [Streptomyces sp. NBC_01216]